MATAVCPLKISDPRPFRAAIRKGVSPRNRSLLIYTRGNGDDGRFRFASESGRSNEDPFTTISTQFVIIS